MHKKLPAFDVLVDLARNDPERLEILRTELTSQIIEAAPNEHRRKRLEGLQFRVDLERQRARSPLAAAIELSEMMCHSLADLHKSMVTPLAADPAARQQGTGAKVRSFAPPPRLVRESRPIQTQTQTVKVIKRRGTHPGN